MKIRPVDPAADSAIAPTLTRYIVAPPNRLVKWVWIGTVVGPAHDEGPYIPQPIGARRTRVPPGSRSFVDRGRETYAGGAWLWSFVDRGRETYPGAAWFAFVRGPWAQDVRGWRA